jgi:hypothetical protein
MVAELNDEGKALVIGLDNCTWLHMTMFEAAGYNLSLSDKGMSDGKETQAWVVDFSWSSTPPFTVATGMLFGPAEPVFGGQAMAHIAHAARPSSGLISTRSNAGGYYGKRFF